MTSQASFLSAEQESTGHKVRAEREARQRTVSEQYRTAKRFSVARSRSMDALLKKSEHGDRE